ncbi:hypothetical protein B0H13DRAFT_1962949 [Mycena leptocephala]|nr:hypothetical protein B0H13DRAFT_1962949 [Mycena leptocephala]
MAQVASVTSIEMNSVLSEKPEIWIEDDSDSQRNPVVESAEFAYHKTNIVQVNDEGVRMAAKHIHDKIRVESYSPRTWRSHPLHICPTEPYAPTEPLNKVCLDWIFLIRPQFQLLESWKSSKPKLWTEHVFRPAEGCSETIPLLRERIAIMREVGFILCHGFGGSFQGFLDEFQRQHNATEQLSNYMSWKRAQILVAETWAAFYPASPETTHPLFPGPSGPAIHQLTMFADYRVPQILHHLRILSYPPALLQLLRAGTMLAPGSREELSLRAASIVAVERRLIDFYLWDLAKKVERGEERIEGIRTTENMVPTHRTRSIWY